MTAEAITARITPGAQPPADLAADRRSRWTTERDLWAPHTARVASGAALIASRPLSAYRSVIDLIADSSATATALLDAVIADASAARGEHPAAIAVQVQEFGSTPFSGNLRAALRAAGFELQEQPVPSVPSTRLDDPTGVAVWTRWSGATPQRKIPFYGQTTEVTCGAVAALDAMAQRGVPAAFGAELAANREAEIGFWRRATNYPACDPIGLAAEMVKTLRENDPSAPEPQVYVSTTDLVLLEDVADNEFELMLRTDLQREALRQADVLGVPIHREWLNTDAIFTAVAGGRLALLLIDLTDLIDDPTPHWVLAYDVVDDHLIISDPWIQYPAGETWADTYALPLPRSTVEVVTRWGDPAYRGVILV